MTRPMPGPPESESCTCYEEVVGPNDPCGTPEGTLQTVVPTSCDFHSWRVRDASRKKRLTDVECAAHRWQAASTLGLALYAPAEVLGVDIPEDGNMYSWERPDAEPLNRAYDAWHRFARTPHALEEA